MLDFEFGSGLPSALVIHIRNGDQFGFRYLAAQILRMASAHLTYAKHSNT
jgi:hypothetical protein